MEASESVPDPPVREPLHVRRKLDIPAKVFGSSVIFFAVFVSAGIVSVLTAPRFIPRSCDRSRLVLDGRWGLVSDDTHPYTNGNYTQVRKQDFEQIQHSAFV